PDDALPGQHAAEGGVNDLLRRSRDHEELEVEPRNPMIEQTGQKLNVPLQADVAPHLDQILATDPAEFRIVPEQIGEFRPLLHQILTRQTRHLIGEPFDAEHLAHGMTRIVKTQGLVEITYQQKIPVHLYLPASGRLNSVRPNETASDAGHPRRL